ncbi:hypothetical protein BVRB_4g076120 [Beta vulgaris subsp. vulgaris]|uniref:Uncharacterized protein n=1 Tax=Beta vulgaris subsp. vulgaris TaxID=3555 RepID=A0A0J8FEK1_BETVV|nr:hypothetical protein BVRB_4g076120 [Beta vulgaris subsp. vulgaris]
MTNQKSKPTLRVFTQQWRRNGEMAKAAESRLSERVHHLMIDL